MVQIVSLQLSGVDYRSHDIQGIYKLNNEIVFLHLILGDIPKEQTNRETTFPYYIVADFFSPDFKKHTQKYIMYHDNKTLFKTCCKCETRNDFLLLNTMYYQAIGGIFRDNSRYNTLAKLIKIQNNSMNEIGESPEPIKETYSDTKTFTFGEFSIHMASNFIMECTYQNTQITIWKLKLNAWLYTDILEKSGILYFGTAGHGGRFYGVSLNSGSVIFAYDTGGTTEFHWYQGNVLLVDRKGDIILLDSEKGIEMKRFKLKLTGSKKYKLNAFTQMLIIDNNLYAVAYPNKKFYDFYALCVDL